jgi:hypothetical protein
VGWLAIPEHDFTRTRVRQTAGESGAPPLTAHARAIAGGYELELTIPRSSVSRIFAIDVLVNEISSGRQRRRGQLVLSGAHGDRVYLRGDRHPLERFVSLRLPE